MTPAILVFVGLTAYPVLRTLFNSVHTIRPRGVEEFVGLANYVELARDGIFWKAVGNTLIWAAVAPVLDVGVGLLLALCLYAKVPFARFFRVAWFTPALISYVVVAIVWTWIYNYDWGAMNEILAWIGLGGLRTAWIGNPATALWALIFVDVWKWAGFNMIVCLAALHSLPSEVVEAAELDRCGWIAKLVFIAVPMIRTTLIGLLILGFIGKMKVFDLIARFLGNPAMNLIPGTLAATDGGLTVRVAGLRLPVAPAAQPGLGPHGDRTVLVGIRPEDLSDRRPDGAASGYVEVPSRVVAVEPLGAETLLILNLDGVEEDIIARVGRDSARQVGDPAGVGFDVRMVRYFDPRTGAAIA